MSKNILTEGQIFKGLLAFFFPYNYYKHYQRFISRRRRCGAVDFLQRFGGGICWSVR